MTTKVKSLVIGVMNSSSRSMCCISQANVLKIWKNKNKHVFKDGETMHQVVAKATSLLIKAMNQIPVFVQLGESVMKTRGG